MSAIGSALKYQLAIAMGVEKPPVRRPRAIHSAGARKVTLQSSSRSQSRGEGSLTGHMAWYWLETTQYRVDRKCYFGQFSTKNFPRGVVVGCIHVSAVDPPPIENDFPPQNMSYRGVGGGWRF